MKDIKRLKNVKDIKRFENMVEIKKSKDMEDIKRSQIVQLLNHVKRKVLDMFWLNGKLCEINVLNAKGTIFEEK